MVYNLVFVHVQMSGEGVLHQHSEYPAASDTSGGNQCLWRADISIQRSCIFVFLDFGDDLQHKVHSSTQRMTTTKEFFSFIFLDPIPPCPHFPQHPSSTFFLPALIPLLLRQSLIILFQQHHLIPAHFEDESSMPHGYCPILFLSITSRFLSLSTRRD